MVTLSGFKSYPLYSTPQIDVNQWLAKMYSSLHKISEERTLSFLNRILLHKIHNRQHYLEHYLHSSPGRMDLPSWTERMEAFKSINKKALRELFAQELYPPQELYHVSCTGYESPSAAQEIVQELGWSIKTRVTHLYHMGCYAAMIALRQAQGSIAADRGPVSVVHTEGSTLHANFESPNKELMIINSLFSDGIIKYRISSEPSRGLKLLQYEETMIPDTLGDMGWKMGNSHLVMELSKEVPQIIKSAISKVVQQFNIKDFANTIFAIHPGGPSIIDSIEETLELSPFQVAFSKDIFFRYGNMSSATLPHIWQSILESHEVNSGTQIISLAFGPGLTVCAAHFEVIR